MVATFPLGIAQFIAQLPVQSISFNLPEPQEMSRTGGGDILRASLGTRLWQGEVTLGRLLRSEAQDAEALLDFAQGAEASFMIFPVHRAAPSADASGTILGSATPQIRELPLDARAMSLKGLPAGYQLKRGDYLSFQYRSNPTRFALHRIQDASVVANSIGNTPLFEVRPHIRPGAVVNTSVQLVQPACKAVVIPESVQSGRTDRFVTDGMSFSFMQTLR